MRTFLAAVAVAWLAMSAPAAALCEPSGAYDVATHDEPPGAIVVWDSSRGLYESVDDGVTWQPTNRLPLGSERASDEVCADGECYRVRADRLGLERQVGDGWQTHWEYEPSDVAFLERQLPGFCGEGHAELGLSVLIAAPEGSSHAVLLAAGADGLWSIDAEGTVAKGLFGEPADPQADPSAVYLTPERVGVGVVAFALGTLLLFWTGPAKSQAIVAGVLGLAALVWTLLPEFGLQSQTVLIILTGAIGISAVALVGRSDTDVAELFIGVFWAVGLGAAVRSVVGAGEARLYSYVPAIVGGMLMVLTIWASRDRSGGTGPWRVLVPVGVGGLVALGIYQLWAMRVIEPKVVADALVALCAVLTAWWGVRAGVRHGT